eukprot:TRINITY_DN36703_c0_g1_i1.p1 TRINITY_DN36703_c0_g1~~TRINITY_DN36703_c0_g1_i1.p1  ORF type:complete len:1099 (-),score=264.72 TRINITY_DN36703_c0_g1_i1:120-3416(-)
MVAAKQARDAWDEESAQAASEESAGPETVLDIKYVDPRTGKLKNRDVYCDPSDWDNFWKARLLISADLVNLLSEAAISRHARFEVFHDKLEKARLGYSCDLHRFRKVVSKAAKAIVTSETSNLESTVEVPKSEVPQQPVITTRMLPVTFEVHFFTVTHDKCIDLWEHEKLGTATHIAKREIKEETRDIRKRIDALGGGTWRELMGVALRDGNDPLGMSEDIMARKTPNEREQRVIDNQLTTGLADRYDEKVKEVEEQDDLMADERRRGTQIEMQTNSAKKRSVELEKMIDDLLRKLRTAAAKDKFGRIVGATGETVKAKEQQPIGPLYARLCKFYEDQLARDRAALDPLKEQLAYWRARAREPDPETARLEQLLREWEAKAKAIRNKGQSTFDMLKRLADRVAKITEKLLDARAAIEDLKDKLATVGPPSPKSTQYTQMKRTLKGLTAITRDLLAKLKEKIANVAVYRSELKKLYENLGWDWEFSESEGDADEDKPYWERRKLAAAMWPDSKLRGLKASLFVAAEKGPKQKRLQKRIRDHKKATKQTIQEQMLAKRQQVDPLRSPGGSSSRPLSRGNLTTSEKDLLQPFNGDTVEQAIAGTVNRLRGSSAGGTQQREEFHRLPAWAHDPKELEWRCVLMVQLQEIRAKLEAKLRRCASCFCEGLAASAVEADTAGFDGEDEDDVVYDRASALVPGGLRLRLRLALDELDSVPVAPGFFEEEEIGDRLEAACASLHELMRESVDFAPEVRHVTDAVKHASNFGEKRQRLTEVRLSQRRLRDELRLVAAAIRGGRVMPTAPLTSASILAATAASGSASWGASFGGTTSLGAQLSASIWAEATQSYGGTLSRGSPSRQGLSTRNGLETVQQSPPGTPPLICEQHRGTPYLARGDFDDQDDGVPARSLSPMAASSRILKSRSKPSFEVDLGFRPDGVGEESLENWSLFKVSKHSDLVSTTVTSQGLGLSSNSSATGYPQGRSRLDAKVVVRKAVGSDLDFGQYVAQMSAMQSRESGQGTWQSKSTPTLGKLTADKRRCPSLPKLVNPSGGSTVGDAAPAAPTASKKRSGSTGSSPGGVQSVVSGRDWKFRASANGGAWMPKW